MSQIKRVFHSRFPEGRIIEVDWSQLEVCCLQIESSCESLGLEISDGVDLHSVMTAKIYGEPYESVRLAVISNDPLWVARRRDTKRARFALQYGAGSKRISQLTGWTLDASKDFILQYYNHYPEIAAWQDKVYGEVLASAEHEFKKGVSTGMVGQYTSPTGRRYIFKSFKDERTGEDKFSPTQLKNYPIQGLAADFVAYVLVELHRRIFTQGLEHAILLVNTIHDSVILDVKKEYSDEATTLIKEVYALAPDYMRAVVRFQRPVTIPLKYAITNGRTWLK